MTEPLFPKALRGVMTEEGDSYELLPPEVKAMHQVESVLVASGRADITRDPSFLANLAATLFRFPKAGVDVPVTVTFIRDEKGETLSRNFGGKILATQFYDVHRPGFLIERFGPLWFLIECICSREGIDMHIRKIWFWKCIPFPMCLAPRINATERAVGGRYRFDVDIRLPGIGRVIHYRGSLAIRS